MLVLMLLMLVPFEALATSIGNMEATSSFLSPLQDHTFYTLGRQWVFYESGNYIYWQTSPDDGTTWSAATQATTPALAGGAKGGGFDLEYDSSTGYLHLVADCGTYYYRRGTPAADGSIAWASAAVSTGCAHYYNVGVSIGVDTDDHAWIAYNYFSWAQPSGTYIYARRNSAHDGSWSTDRSDNIYIAPTGGFYHTYIHGMASGGGRMALFTFYCYSGGGRVPIAAYFDGGSWSSWHNAVHTTQYDSYARCTADVTVANDDAYIVWYTSTAEVVYSHWSYSSPNFGTEYHIDTGFSAMNIPVVEVDADEGNIWVYWSKRPDDNNIYVKCYNVSLAAWSSSAILVTPSDNIPSPNFYMNTDPYDASDRLHTGIYYIRGTNTLDFKLLDEAFIVDTLTPTPLGNTYATLRGEIMSLGFGSANETGFWFNTSSTLVGAIQEGNVTGTFNVGVFTHGITGLLAAHTYWYVAYASGDYGTSYGNWTSFYTTSPPVPTPPAGGNVTGDTATICNTIVWNFLAQPVTNTDIKLTWDWWPVSGNSSTQIAIYYGLYYYPIDLADGTLIYQGTGDAYTHTNLLPGTTYYYRAWLLCGGNYSADYVQDWATTYGSSPVVSPPEQPEGWFQDPNCTAYSKIPLLSDALVAVTTAYGFPATTVCVMFTLLWIIVLGLAVFLFIHSAMMMIITIAVLIILASIMGLLPLWMIVIAICLGGISIYISGRT